MIKKYAITVNGVTYDVEVEELRAQASSVSRPTQVPQVQQQVQPQVKTQEPPPAKPPVTQPQGSSSINAPMPGTINDIKVKVGDSVKKGQVLLILEAMKMENELMASGDGTIVAINTSKGASVSVGDELVTIA